MILRRSRSSQTIEWSMPLQGQGDDVEYHRMAVLQSAFLEDLAELREKYQEELWITIEWTP